MTVFRSVRSYFPATLIAKQKFTPDFYDAIFFASNLHPVIAKDEVFAGGCLNYGNIRMQRFPVCSSQVNALNMMVPIIR